MIQIHQKNGDMLDCITSSRRCRTAGTPEWTGSNPLQHTEGVEQKLESVETCCITADCNVGKNTRAHTLEGDKHYITAPWVSAKASNTVSLLCIFTICSRSLNRDKQDIRKPKFFASLCSISLLIPIISVSVFSRLFNWWICWLTVRTGLEQAQPEERAQSFQLLHK